MTWPWMQRRTHVRIYAQQGAAYRRDIEDLRRERDRLSSANSDFVSDMVKHVSADRQYGQDENVLIRIVVAPYFTRRESSDLPRLIAENVARQIFDLHRDWRGDMRQSPTQRALGL